FEYVNDPEKLREWMQGLEETTYLGDYDPDHPLGTKFKQRIREHGKPKEYEGVVTDYDKPSHLGVKIHCDHFSVQVNYRFSRIPTGTRLDYEAEIMPANFLTRVMLFLFGWLAKGVTKKQLDKLKGAAERQPV